MRRTPGPCFRRDDGNFRRHSRERGNPAWFVPVALLALVLTACGFHLRGQATYTFNTIYVNAAGSPPIATAMKRALGDTGSATVADDPTKAQVILDIPSVVDDKEVLSLSQSGAVREYELVKVVSFRLHDAEGNDWLPAAQVVVRRSYTFNETEVLARDAQEQRLLREMTQDVVQQIIRRLQAAHKPA
ncbi:MAG TPA: LPS assembly lipoprotein LptE [Casimicrobiaceae bacterium]|jgi:LPS-assembly lipoprotein